MRASSARSCARKACYEHAGTPERPITRLEERIFWRGKSLERDYVDSLEREHGQVERQVEVKWGHGWTGHADAYIPAAKTLVEVLSSAHASPEMVESKMRQLVFYMEHHPEAERGLLVVLDPATFEEDRYPLVKHSATYQKLATEVQERIEQIYEWEATGNLPERVCRKPNDARKHFCRVVGTCFAGWEEPPLTEVENEQAKEIARAVINTKEEEKYAKAALKALEDARKELQEELAELVDYGSHSVGDIKVTRTLVHRSPTVDMRKAEAAGYPVHSLDEFLKPGATYDLWSVEQIDDEGEPVDYGDTPPF